MKLEKYPIFYVSALCGAGKTYSLARYIANKIQNTEQEELRHFLYVAPTKDLLEQERINFTKQGVPNCEVFKSDDEINDFNQDNHTTVYERFIKRVFEKETQYKCKVFFITHALYFHLAPNICPPSKWEKFIDEIPQFDFYQPLEIPFIRPSLRENLKISRFKNTLSLIKPIDKNRLSKLLKSKDEALKNKNFKEVLHKVLSPNFRVYAPNKAYETIFEGSKAKDPYLILDILSTVHPHIFNGCCFLGANFEKSMLFHAINRELAKKGKIELKKHEELYQGLRYEKYDASVGQRTKIFYCLKDRHFSKYLRDKDTINLKPVIKEMHELALNFVGNNKFLLLANNGDEGPLTKAENVKRLPGSPYGLNSYQDYTYIVCFAALNRTPQHLSMIENLGFPEEMIFEETTVERVHQAVMRTNLRDPGSKEVVNVIVADKRTAFALGSIIGCSHVERLGNIELLEKEKTKEKEPLTQTENNRNSICRKHFDVAPPKDKNNQKSVGNYPLNNRLKPTEIVSKLDQEQLDQLGNNWRIYLTSAIKKHDLLAKDDPRLYYNKREEFIVREWDFKGFKKTLRIASGYTTRSKSEVELFKPCLFSNLDLDKGIGYITKDNFLSCSCIFLDFDNKDLSPQKFKDIFWNNVGEGTKLSFVICNTFSRSQEQPNRFRVIIPFKKPVTELAVFRSIYEDIVVRLHQERFYPKNNEGLPQTGLDTVCSRPNQFYYAPCINAEAKGFAFFEEYGMEPKEFFYKYGLDPTPYEITLPPEIRAVDTNINDGERTISECLKDWMNRKRNELISMDIGVRKPFYNYALSIYKSGLTFNEVELEVFDIANRNPHSKMKRYAIEIMKRLCKKFNIEHQRYNSRKTYF